MQLGRVVEEQRNTHRLVRSLEARVATCETAEAEAVSVSAVMSEERERARHEVRETAASARQFANGVTAELEELKSEVRADGHALRESRGETAQAHDVARQQDRGRDEAEQEAKAAKQGVLMAEDRLRRATEELAQREAKVQTLEVQIEGKLRQSMWNSWVVELELVDILGSGQKLESRGSQWPSRAVWNPESCRRAESGRADSARADASE